MDEQQLLEAETELKTEAARQELASEEQANWEDVVAWQEARETQEQEIAYANQLALAQEQAIQQEEESRLQKISQSFSGPSLFKYGIVLILFALPNDIIDLLDLTGIGMIISWIVSAFLSVSSIIVTWLADSELQRVKEHMKNIDKYKNTARRALARYSTRLLKFAPRNPVMKVIAGAVLELVPVISILPWASICVYLAYLDERHSFGELKEQSKELMTSPESVQVV